MAETINIAYVFDDKFSDKFSVAAYSAAINATATVAIHIVDCGISNGNKCKILELSGKCKNIASIEFGTPERVETLEKFPMAAHFSSAVFYRLAIPKIFPDLKRVIYMDCDTIVDGDIATLWNEDLKGHPFGAVEEDDNFFYWKTRGAMRQRLGLSNEKRYYISGVLLIDCAEFERSKIFERVINQVKTTDVHLVCPEQDAMNVCLENGEHMPLSPVYNFCPSTPLANKCLKKNPNIVIIHYSMCKAWKTNKRLMEVLNAIGLFRYSTAILLKFWKYADDVGFEGPAEGSISYSLHFLYKRTLQPLERFVSEKIRDNFLNFIKKLPRPGAFHSEQCEKK
jgi:lipopolysaccharide biosynthesis glycosyltransferase